MSDWKKHGSIDDMNFEQLSENNTMAAAKTTEAVEENSNILEKSINTIIETQKEITDKIITLLEKIDDDITTLHGYNIPCAWFKISEKSSTLYVGYPVAIVDNYDVNDNMSILYITDNGATDLLGIVKEINEENGEALVQLYGYVELETNGEDIGRGWESLGFNGVGKVKPGGDHFYYVVYSNSQENKIGFYL